MFILDETRKSVSNFLLKGEDQFIFAFKLNYDILKLNFNLKAVYFDCVILKRNNYDNKHWRIV